MSTPGVWCTYCRKATHNDVECWATRPEGWKPGDAHPAPTYPEAFHAPFSKTTQAILAALKERNPK